MNYSTTHLSMALGFDVKEACLDFLYNAMNYIAYKPNNLNFIYEGYKEYLKSRIYNTTHCLHVMDYYHDDKGYRIFVSTTRDKVIEKITELYKEFDEKNICREESLSIKVHDKDDKILIFDDLYYVDEKGHLFHHYRDSSLLPLGLENCLHYIFRAPYHYLIKKYELDPPGYTKPRHTLKGLMYREFLGRLYQSEREMFFGMEQQCNEIKQNIENFLNQLNCDASLVPIHHVEEDTDLEKMKFVVHDEYDLLLQGRIVVKDGDKDKVFLASYLTGNLYYKKDRFDYIKILPSEREEKITKILSA